MLVCVVVEKVGYGRVYGVYYNEIDADNAVVDLGGDCFAYYETAMIE